MLAGTGCRLQATVHHPAMVQAVRMQSTQSFKCVVLGGGTGGCAMAHKMTRVLGPGNVAVIEPADRHYYQPLFTLVGSGHKNFTQTYQTMGSSLPKQAQWIKDSVASFCPGENTVTTSAGLELKYDMLIVALGLHLDFEKIPGLTEALQEDPMVVSNFSPDYVQKTYKAFEAFKGGDAIFTFPPMPIKCPGAPQKIMYLFDDHLRRKGTRQSANIMYNTNLPVIFGVKKYAERLMDVVKDRNLTVNFKHNLVEVKQDTKEAVFALVDSDPKETVTFKYDFLHATPPMSAPACLRSSDGETITDPAGFLDINKETLQHNVYSNIFGIGDCTSLPTSRTAAAIAAESGVLGATIQAVMKGKKPEGRKYDGYTSCPLITKQGKTILAEFDYNGQPLETFPLDQGNERRTMWYMKKDVMPFIYWKMLIRGRWHGPEIFRKLFSFGRR